jgi:hypothetical protein
MFKNPILWTSITAILTVLVYIDTFFLGVFLFTIPMAVAVAIISIIISVLQRKYKYIFHNLLLAVIACLCYVIFPW